MGPNHVTVVPMAPSMARLAYWTEEVTKEVTRAMHQYPPMNSAHEGFAVLLEEMDELRAHVWKKQGLRDLAGMREEAMQVAAMALRFLVDSVGPGFK